MHGFSFVVPLYIFRLLLLFSFFFINVPLGLLLLIRFFVNRPLRSCPFASVSKRYSLCARLFIQKYVPHADLFLFKTNSFLHKIRFEIEAQSKLEVAYCVVQSLFLQCCVVFMYLQMGFGDLRSGISSSSRQFSMVLVFPLFLQLAVHGLGGFFGI